MKPIASELKNQDNRINCVEINQQQVLKRLEFIEGEIHHLRHLVSKNEELENKISFYEPPD